MKVVLIRHLKTPGNEKRQYIGRADEDLSEKEIQKFQQEQRQIFYPQVQKVIVSPMKRCVQTAELIYPEVQMRMDPLLKECDFGIFEGKSYEELKDRPEYQAWLDSGGTIAFPGGEGQADFRMRCVQGMLQQITRLCEEQAESAAFVVHGGTIMAVLERLAEDKEDFYHWQVENGGGYQMTVNVDEWKQGERKFHEICKIEKKEIEIEKKEIKRGGCSQ